MDLRQLAALPLDQASKELDTFDSQSRAGAMVFVMLATRGAADRIRVFQDWGCQSDLPWPWQSVIAELLRQAFSEVEQADVLPLDARSFYDKLPDLVPVWRGCEQGRERGLHWTTVQATAEKIATGLRCSNPRPTLAQAQIPKQCIFAVFLERNESEIALDPRRLRHLSTTPVGVLE